MNKRVVIYEVIELALIIVFIFFPVRYFVFRPFIVKGESMTPNFQSGDYLIIDELTYHFRRPERGEVVVFKAPPMPQDNYIKRVIGLPGETVKINSGQITIYSKEHPQGLTLKENYLLSSEKTGVPGGQEENINLAKNQYFVLGDNRFNSYDSRSWGVLPKSDIIGRVLLRLWPPQGIMGFAQVRY